MGAVMKTSLDYCIKRDMLKLELLGMIQGHVVKFIKAYEIVEVDLAEMDGTVEQYTHTMTRRIRYLKENEFGFDDGEYRNYFSLEVEAMIKVLQELERLMDMHKGEI
jgi:hypothetical protein